MNTFPKLGYTGISCNFSNDSNTATREFYVKEEVALKTMLEILLGNPYLGILPHAHPSFTSFRCYDVAITPVNGKSVQGSRDTDTDIQGFLDAKEHVVGYKVVATYRPIADEGSIKNITEETFDFSAQTMCLIGNQMAADKASGLHWASDNKLCINVRSIVKIIPKVDIIQKRIYLQNVPGSVVYGKIGSINNADFSFTQSRNGGNLNEWKAGTLLFLGCPTTRKFRWDGQFNTEVTLKFAANVFRDKIYGGTEDFVTWNRLFRPKEGYWDKVQIGTANKLLYPEVDFSIFNTMK
jgi:hypothetical protein